MYYRINTQGFVELGDTESSNVSGICTKCTARTDFISFQFTLYCIPKICKFCWHAAICKLDGQVLQQTGPQLLSVAHSGVQYPFKYYACVILTNVHMCPRLLSYISIYQEVQCNLMTWVFLARFALPLGILLQLHINLAARSFTIPSFDIFGAHCQMIGTMFCKQDQYGSQGQNPEK